MHHKFPLTRSLFADDYSIPLQLSNLIELRDSIMKAVCLRTPHPLFRQKKTKNMHGNFLRKVFTLNSHSTFIPPKLSNQSTELISVKRLSFTFEHKLSWRPHIKILKAKCLYFVNILQYQLVQAEILNFSFNYRKPWSVCCWIIVLQYTACPVNLSLKLLYTIQFSPSDWPSAHCSLVLLSACASKSANRFSNTAF